LAEKFIRQDSLEENRKQSMHLVYLTALKQLMLIGGPGFDSPSRKKWFASRPVTDGYCLPVTQAR
jgi:hypothetical protein